MNVSKSSIAGLAQDTMYIAKGEATAKDVTSREMSKFKNFLKSTAKWGVASAAFSGAGAVLGAQMGGADLISKLPKFAQNGINNLLNKDSVKKFATAISDAIGFVGGILVKGAKAHPIAAAACLGISAIGTAVGLKIAYDHGKANGKADQKFDDTVQVNKELRTQNPLNA